VPIQTTYPGVYIEEVPSAVRTIVGVSTSVTAFIGYTKRGATNLAVRLLNYGDYEREFGELDTTSPVSYAVQQFFGNGGREAYVVRVAEGASQASVLLENVAGNQVLEVRARTEGVWGNGIRLDVDWDSANRDDLFDITATEYRNVGGVLQPATSETYLNLSMDSASRSYVVDTVNASSRLLEIERVAGIEGNVAVANARGSSESGPLINTDLNGLQAGMRLLVSVDGGPFEELVLAAPSGATFQQRFASVVTDLQGAATTAGLALIVTSNPSPATSPARLRLRSNATGEHSSVRVQSAPSQDAAAVLKLGPGRGGTQAGAAAWMRPAQSGTAGAQIANPGGLPAGPAQVRLTINRGTAGALAQVGAGVDERQTVTIAGGATGGTFRIGFRGATSNPIAFGATAAVVETALEGMGTIGIGNIDVTGVSPAYTLDFKGTLAATDLPEVTGDASGLTGGTPTITIATTQQGQPLVTLWQTTAPTTVEGARAALEGALRAAARFSFGAADELSGATVTTVGDGLRVVLGGHPDSWVSVTAFGVAPQLGLSAPISENLANYSLGVGAAAQFQAAPTPGADGTPPASPGPYIGQESQRTGLFALDVVPLFNLLCIPGRSDAALLSAAMAYCERRRAFYVVDLPEYVDSRVEAEAWISAAATPKSKNAAAYFPWVRLQDPMLDYRPRAFPPSGMVAGLYARTDGTRGVWKAPAGTDARLFGPIGLAYVLSDDENGTLNPLGLNAIRSLRDYGIVTWGARTLQGADKMASEWKYVPVRRLALFLEESLYQGTQWVVFEPNDEPLWAQIRLNVGAFMQSLFRQGAFQGSSPREAYLVKCDKETTTQNDINLGIVNIVVGFAPLKPAEFVIIKITQLAGQVEA
jgi:phage tail sheath protein FI